MAAQSLGQGLQRTVVVEGVGGLSEGKVRAGKAAGQQVQKPRGRKAGLLGGVLWGHQGGQQQACGVGIMRRGPL